jgi:hypothetical protein
VRLPPCQRRTLPWTGNTCNGCYDVSKKVCLLQARGTCCRWNCTVCICTLALIWHDVTTMSAGLRQQCSGVMFLTSLSPCCCSDAHCRHPPQLTAPEQKRGGKPAIHSKHREVTGKNAHAARDYRGHAAQVRGCACVRVGRVSALHSCISTRSERGHHCCSHPGLQEDKRLLEMVTAALHKLRSAQI